MQGTALLRSLTQWRNNVDDAGILVESEVKDMEMMVISRRLTYVRVVLQIFSG